MDILRKRLLTISTVTSVIILLMGNAVGDSNQKEVTKGMMLSPPPGPFFKGSSSITSKENILVAPIAPTKPTNNLQEPELKANSIEFKMLSPKLKKAELKKPKLISIPAKELIAPVLQQNSPKLVQKIGKAPKNHSMPQSNIKEPSQRSSKSEPIWAQQQRLINQESNVATNSKNQNNKANMQYQNYNGRPNIGWSYPVQQYMYIPVPMMIPPTVPQMPLAPSFRAPMPFYNNIPQGNNDDRAVDRIIMPAQKDNK